MKNGIQTTTETVSVPILQRSKHDSIRSHISIILFILTGCSPCRSFRSPYLLAILPPSTEQREERERRGTIKR